MGTGSRRWRPRARRLMHRLHARSGAHSAREPRVSRLLAGPGAVSVEHRAYSNIMSFSDGADPGAISGSVMMTFWRAA